MTTIKFRRDTSVNWTSVNPIPAQGEPCYETDTGKLKIGNGSDNYVALPYVSDGGGSSGDLPIATATTLGGIKVGNNLSITEDGTLSANDGAAIDDTTASTTTTYSSSKIEEQLTDKANVDLENLTEAGEKHFLNKSQIANCLLEVPQRIKLELNNGVLTLKAGSQVIVPNGFEADGTTPKFDYVPVYDDKTIAAGVGDKTLFFSIDESYVTSITSNKIVSGATDSLANAKYHAWYDTTNNIIQRYGSDVSTYTQVSFPLAITTFSDNTTCSSIDQVFNGMGYIGSTVWVDKGVKGLIPNGRNEDGTLKNIEYTTEGRVYTEQTSRAENEVIIVAIDDNGRINAYVNYFSQEENPNTPYTCWYKPSENNFYTSDGQSNFSLASIIPLAGYTSSNLQITSLTPKLPFRAVDYNDVGGQWVSSVKELSTATAVGTYTINLSSYLPNDNYSYEVILEVSYVNKNATDGFLKINTSLVKNLTIARANTAAEKGGYSQIIPVGYDKKAILKIESHSFDRATITAIAYRRIGTNQ